MDKKVPHHITLGHEDFATLIRGGVISKTAFESATSSGPENVSVSIILSDIGFDLMDAELLTARKAKTW